MCGCRDEHERRRGWRGPVGAGGADAVPDGHHKAVAPGAPGVRIEQTRRRPAKLRTEGLVDRVTLPLAGRTRARFPTEYGCGPRWSGRSSTVGGHRGWCPIRWPRGCGHTLAVTETALAFLEARRCRDETCLPLDWLPEVHHPICNGEAIIPDALLYYRSDAMMRAFIEVDRATMGPERLAEDLMSNSPDSRGGGVRRASC
ncbi:replication-relaxation family protein [Streptomyces sp. NPDC058665]|uniref:replication-relaxation family protein n=1 Tax=Streptomyces sp. NPDC058665 TaxID=3346586 RepID=UPI00365AD000